MTRTKPISPNRRTSVDTESIVAALPIGLLVVDEHGIVLTTGGIAENLLQMSRSSIEGKSLAQIFGENSPLVGLMKKAGANLNTVMEHDMRLCARKDNTMIVDGQVTPLLDTSEGFLITLQSRQIPNIVGQQDSVKAASKSVSGLAAMLAHEIKNPLSGIRGAAQLLVRRAAEDEKKFPKLICREVDRISGLVNDLEAFTDPKPHATQAVNIHEVLNHVSDVAKAGFASQIALKAIYDPSLPVLAGNYDRLVQVFLNLVKNGAEAIGDREGGELKLTTAYRSGLWVGGEGEKRRKLPFEITVEDNGGGIPLDIIDHLFEPFVTGHEGGTGLGLALVAHFVADMDGTIECENSDEGAIFKVHLPAYVEPPLEKPTPENQKQKRMKHD